jgi:hypothetical protein
MINGEGLRVGKRRRVKSGKKERVKGGEKRMDTDTFPFFPMSPPLTLSLFPFLFFPFPNP